MHRRNHHAYQSRVLDSVVVSVAWDQRWEVLGCVGVETGREAPEAVRLDLGGGNVVVYERMPAARLSDADEAQCS